jgi:hypothetical protein
MTDPDAKDSVNLPPDGDAPVDKTEAPDLANLMGFGGLIPFFLCAGVAHSGVSPWNMLALMACGIYGGIILSFIGAVHWGLAMQDGRPQRYFCVVSYAGNICLADGGHARCRIDAAGADPGLFDRLGR